MATQVNNLEGWENRWGQRVHILVILGLLALFWYRTNSWPLVAVVNYQPIWAWELSNVMYAQVGEQALDNLVTESLIKDELANKKVDVADSEVDTKVAEIKAQIGSDESFQQALAMQGMTENQLRDQIKMQIGLEKIAEPSTDSAQMQENVYTKVSDLRSSGKVWLTPRQ